jgi:hypothetical protein
MRRVRCFKAFAGICCALFGVHSALADSLDNWHALSPSPQINALYRVAFAGNLFLAVGANGAISSSTNGSNWTNQNSGSLSALRGITFGNETYVIAGYSLATRTILISTNVTQWRAKIAAPASFFLATTFAAGTFVTVGNTGTIQTSTNGISWTNRVAITSNDLYGVAYGGGNLVAVGTNGTIITSSDGINWTNSVSAVTNFLRDVAYGDGTFVVVGHDGTILNSTNGVDWSGSNSGTTNRLFGIGHGQGTFVAVGSAGTILTSTDAINWIPRNSGVTNNLFGIAYGNGNFVAVGLGGVILYPGTVPQPVLTAVAHQRNGFKLTITGEIGHGYRLQFSPDLFTWTDLLSYTNTLFNFQYLDTSATHAPIRFYRVVTP